MLFEPSELSPSRKLNMAELNLWPALPMRRAIVHGLAMSIYALCVSLIIYSQVVGSVLNAGASVFFVFSEWLVFCFFLASLHFADHKFLPSAFYTAFYGVGLALSATMIDRGSYMFEIGSFGTSNGVLWVAMLFSTIALHSQFIGFEVAHRRVTDIRDRLAGSDLLSYAFVAVTLAASIAIVLVYGTPSTSGQNRILYWGQVAPSFLSPIRIAITISVFIAAYWALKSRSVVAIAAVAAVYTLVAVGLLGEKFSIFVLYVFFVGVIAACVFTKKGVIRFYTVATVAGIFLLAGVAVYYQTQGLGMGFVGNRLAVQTQVLWSVMNEGSDTLIGGFLGNCQPNCAKLLDPRDLVADRYLPASLYQQRQIDGTTLSGYNPAVPILYMGIILAAFAQAAAGLFLGVLQGHVVRSVENETLTYAFLLAVAYYFATMLWFVMNQNLVVPLVGMLAICAAYRVGFIRVAEFKRSMDGARIE